MINENIKFILFLLFNNIFKVKLFFIYLLIYLFIKYIKIFIFFIIK